MVGALYLGAGLPMGVVSELLPVWLHAQGSSLKAIGLASLLSLPWTLKVQWAPLVDRWGRPMGWAQATLLAMAICTAAVPHLGLGPAVWLALLALTTASATYDLAVDGWTAAAFPPEAQGRVGGLRVAAYRVAMLLAGGGAVALSEDLSWPLLFGLLGAGFLLVLPATRAVPAAPPPAPQAPLDFLRELWAWAGARGPADALRVTGFVLAYKLGDAALGPMVKPFWLESGFSPRELGLVSISLGTGLSIAGALLGGELCSRLGLVRGLWLLGGVQALSNLGYAAAALGPSRLIVYGASVVESLCGGLGTAAFLATLMALTEGRQATTRFALLTALMGLTRTLSGALSGFGAESMGFPGWFSFSFLLALPAFAFLPAIARRLG